jgi:hypothetical protein
VHSAQRPSVWDKISCRKGMLVFIVCLRTLLEFCYHRTRLALYYQYDASTAYERSHHRDCLNGRVRLQPCSWTHLADCNPLDESLVLFSFLDKHDV